MYYFGLNIEAEPYRMGQNNIDFVCIGYTPSSPSVNLHIPRHQLDKEFNLEPPKLGLYQLTRTFSSDHIFYGLILLLQGLFYSLLTSLLWSKY